MAALNGNHTRVFSVHHGAKNGQAVSRGQHVSGGPCRNAQIPVRIRGTSRFTASCAIFERYASAIGARQVNALFLKPECTCMHPAQDRL